jgi:hypothetical protein
MKQTAFSLLGSEAKFLQKELRESGILWGQVVPVYPVLSTEALLLALMQGTMMGVHTELVSRGRQNLRTHNNTAG